MESAGILLLLAISVSQSSAVNHTLKYLNTISSGIPNLPEYVVVGMLDDVQTDYFDSDTRRAEPRQEWRKKVSAEDPQFWEKQTPTLMSIHQRLKSKIEMLKPHFNVTDGVYTVQFIYGCEWDDETGKSGGIYKFGYGGEDLLSFNLKEETLVAAKPEAEIITQELNQDKRWIERLTRYFTYYCAKWLKKYVDYGRSSLMRTELPSVSLLQKEPSSPVTCVATGFYPGGATLSWRRGEEELHEEVEPGEILPNPDGTFQMSAALDLSSVPPEDWSSYKCVFQLSGGQEVPTSLDRKRIRTNRGKTGVRGDDENPSNTSTIVGVAVLVLVLGAIAGFLVSRQRKGESWRWRQSSPPPVGWSQSLSSAVIKWIKGARFHILR